MHVYVHAAVKQEAHVAFRASARCPSWRLIALFLEVETDENLTARYPPIECFALQDVRRARPCSPGSALPSRCRDRPLREVCRRRLCTVPSSFIKFAQAAAVQKLLAVAAASCGDADAGAPHSLEELAAKS